jgi:hypothetical protein
MLREILYSDNHQRALLKRLYLVEKLLEKMERSLLEQNGSSSFSHKFASEDNTEAAMFIEISTTITY